MNDIPALDDFEHDVVRTLRVKADQLVLDEAPFRPDARGPSPFPGRAPHSRQPAPARRRLLAAAAAVALLVGGVAVVQRLSADTADTAMAGAPIVWSTMPEEGTAAFVPAAMPDGWTLDHLNADSGVSDGPATWQLFAVDGTSPLSRGVLIESAVHEDRVLGAEPTHTVHGHPALFDQTNHPLVPADALELVWADGDVFHDVTATGLTEAELLDFLESLVPHDDPATGFDAPPDAGLPKLDEVATEASYSSSLGYVDPSGNDTVTLRAEKSGFGGGLLHRLAGTPQGDGLLIRGGGQDYQFASLMRSDGWEVEASARPALADPRQLDAILDSVEPTTRQQLIDMVAAEPVTATEAVGDWTIEVHGNDLADLALCLTVAGGETECTTAQTGAGLMTGSAIVDGEWVVVVFTDGTEAAKVETAPSGPDPSPEGFSVETLHGETRQSGDHVVEVLTIPTDVEAVAAIVPVDDDGSQAGLGYHRPQR
jgi:hypothetical protein